MSDLDYFKGEWSEFKKWSARENAQMRSELDKIAINVEALRLWKAGLLGGAAVIGAVAGFLGSLIK